MTEKEKEQEEGKAPVQSYTLADLTLDTGQCRVWRDGQDLGLSKLTFELLKALVEASPNLLSHEQLVDLAWGPRRIVSHENLAQRILKLRRQLGDDPNTPRYIESVRGRGYRLIPEVRQASQPGGAVPVAAHQAAFIHRPWKALASGAVLALGVIMLLAWRGYASNPGFPDTERETRIANSVAVLPFSLDSDNIVVTGLHAQLLDQFNHVPELSVISRPSIVYLSDREMPPAQLAETLNVEYLVQGDVRLDRHDITVDITLIDGLSGQNLDSQHYEGDVLDVFAIQANIVDRITTLLNLELPPGQLARIAEPLSRSVEAYEFYLRGVESLEADTPMASRDGLEYLDQAINIDPDFAMAHAIRSLIGAFQLNQAAPAGTDSREHHQEKFDTVLTDAGKALALDPDNEFAYYALALANLYTWRWETADTFFRKALDSSPGNSIHQATYGWFQACILRQPEGVNALSRALALDPQNHRIHELFGRSMGCLGDRNAAFAAMARAAELQPTIFRFRAFRAMLGAGVLPDEEELKLLQELEPTISGQRINYLPFIALSYARIGRHDDAARIVSWFRDTGYEEPRNWVHAYLAIGDRENALKTMEKLVGDLVPGPAFLAMVDLKWNNRELPMLEEPEFVALRERIHSIE